MLTSAQKFFDSFIAGPLLPALFPTQHLQVAAVLTEEFGTLPTDGGVRDQWLRRLGTALYHYAVTAQPSVIATPE